MTADSSGRAAFSDWLCRGRKLVQNLLPGSCVLCGSDSARTLCAICHARFFKQTTTRCTVCAIGLQGASRHAICGACQAEAPAFDATVVACDYAAPADHLVQDLKFHGKLALAATMAQLLTEALQLHPMPAADLMTAVPLSRSRLAERGFNQALEIARPLAKQCDVPLAAQLCLRVRETAAQAGLPFKQRSVNMRGAFVVSPDAADIANKHVIVVDDVMTTGRTLHELAACLKRHGAARVSNLVVARTPAH
jgi:ComF family protein